MTAPETTVVIVEDDLDLAKTFAEWLADTCHTRIARTAAEAVETIDETADVVLLDRQLPDRPGAELLEEIRMRGIDCPVAIITGVEPDFEMLDITCDDYVVKPVHEDELEAIVQRQLDIARYDIQVRESFGLASKLMLLEEEKSAAELEASETYAEMRDRFEAIQGDIELALAEFDDDHFLTAYRSLDREPATGSEE